LVTWENAVPSINSKATLTSPATHIKILPKRVDLRFGFYDIISRESTENHLHYNFQAWKYEKNDMEELFYGKQRV